MSSNDYAGTEKLHAAIVDARPYDPQFIHQRPNPGAPAFWPTQPLTAEALQKLGISPDLSA
jgi:hypothetical protein